MSAAAPALPRLCRATELGEGEGRGFSLGSGRERLEILLVRKHGLVQGYLNSCPHLGTPLDWTPDRFVSADGEHLLCATHGAMFRIEDGFCVFGPCAGDRLKPVPLVLDEEGWLRCALPA